MSLSRFCHPCGFSRIVNLSPFLKPAIPHHVKAYYCSPNKEFKRMLFMSQCYQRNTGMTSKDEQLARSRPRLHKKFESDRIADNLPKDWTLIYTTSAYKMKLNIAYWVTLTLVASSPLWGCYLMWEAQEEEDVLFAAIPIRKSTEYLLFAGVHIFICYSLLRLVRSLPLRIYFNEKMGRYMLICRSLIPWKQFVRVEFKSTDIRDLPGKKTPITLKPWRDNEFRVHKRVFMFPYFGFRNGHDRYWMLRHAR